MADFLELPVRPGFAPMEAKLAAALPDGEGWRFEPKWDGFRCIAFREGNAIMLQSKGMKPLGRYFPEVEAALAELAERRFVVDGELLIETGGTLSFAALQQRLHPAASRIRKLAAETPARLMLFDCLALGGDRLADQPLRERRAALEAFVARNPSPALMLSPYSCDGESARGWLARSGAALDGVIAKRSDEAYRPGERAMVKVKTVRSADCVVGGFRYASAGDGVGSLLLGLYNRQGALDHVGFTSAIPSAERDGLQTRLEALAGPPGFTGKAPGGPSRWSTDRSAAWRPLRPELVVEVGYDQITGDRFRHAARFLRWRPDKSPDQCRFDQLGREASPVRLAATLAGKR